MLSSKLKFKISCQFSVKYSTQTYTKTNQWGRYWFLIGKGDNLQLFISPLLKYEEWLYNIIDDKNFEINSLELPCTGGLKIPHTPIGTCRNEKKWNRILNLILIVVKICSNDLKKKKTPRSFWLELFRFLVLYTDKYTEYGLFSWK